MPEVPKGMEVTRLTKGRYPLSDLECLSDRDSENIAHLSDSVVLSASLSLYSSLSLYLCS